MSVPPSQEPRHDNERWEVVRFAMTSNPLTARFCVIWLVMTGVPIAMVIWLVTTGLPATTAFELLRNILLHAHLRDRGQPAGP